MCKSLMAAVGILFLSALWLGYSLPPVHDVSCTVCDLPFVEGHDVLVTQTPEESTYWKMELIKEANQSIEFAVGFTGGPLLEQTLLVIDSMMSAKPNLQVRLFISDCPLFGWADRFKLENLEARYPERFQFLIRGMSGLRNGCNLVTSENHIKMLIVDEKYVVLGGTNLFHLQSRSEVPVNSSYENIVNYFHPKAGMDMDIVMKGPNAFKLRSDFYKLWALYESGESTTIAKPFVAESTRYFNLDSSSLAVCSSFDSNPRVVRGVSTKAFISGPRCSPGACSSEYAALINSSERSIDLMQMYLSPVDLVYNSLIAASSRGVAITLITNGGGEITPLVTKTIGSYNQAHLLPVFLGKRFSMGQRHLADACQANNCSMYAYEVEETLYHKKVMLVDDHLTVIGSYNLGQKSHYGDYEVLVEIESKEVAQHIKQVMEVDRQKARLCTREQMTDWHFGLGSRSLALIEGAFILGPLY